MPLAAFHDSLQRWFDSKFEGPTRPQAEAWPKIREGGHVLVAAPTGTGKTLAAFLCAIDSLLKQGDALPAETQVLYISPLKALGNDVQKNLQGPLAELRALDPSLPDVRVLVRSGDTTSSDRQKMLRKPPHILVTTPESLYILLTSDGGRRMLETVRSVIVDEIHAVAGDKRGSHLALSLERLSALTGEVQRIGLSATQKPLSAVAKLLVGKDRDCCLLDAGHLRKIDLEIVVPDSPLAPVCSHETWEEIYAKIALEIEAHKSTLIFVNTRRLAERIAARLADTLPENTVTCHHGSLSKERRLEAEQRLKDGKLRALVATASLELGIDIGDVDLVIQVGITPTIAVLLQRIGRSGHALGRTPKGRVYPLTPDELVVAAALDRSIRRGDLDRTPEPPAALDILCQQIVAACVPESWDEAELFDTLRRAWPYRELSREDFDAAVSLHCGERLSLLHRDETRGQLRATKRARLPAITSGGAIPDNANFRVLLEPSELFVGTVEEDFAIESQAGDIFQLGNHSWRILSVRQGVIRVADAENAPPTIPFWFGEAPARSRELSRSISEVREHAREEHWLEEETGLAGAARTQVRDYLDEGARVLGCVPTEARVVAERFFDEGGGQQLVIHCPYGSRLTRAFGLALRKRFCRGFGYELQAAANEEAILISLGPMHSFDLLDVFEYLHPHSVEGVLTQAILDRPVFETRWRWNTSRSLMLPRMSGGKRTPPQIQRMRADDLLAACCPSVAACPENLPSGDLEISDHPMIQQTIHDCLHEAMDLCGLTRLLEDMRGEKIELRAIDTPEPSAFARGVLSAGPYAFLDDAPLEERRAQAVRTRRSLSPELADELGALDPAAVARVREEAWPQPEDAEELHECLQWMGYVEEREAEPFRPFLEELLADGRAEKDGERYYASGTTREPKELMRGRLEALGPIVSDEPTLALLESEGAVLRCRVDGTDGWCNRRLLARIHRYTLETLRKQIEAVSSEFFLRFLACWQFVDPEYRLEGPKGVALVVERLAGYSAPAIEWERSILPARVRRYRREWLDQITQRGEVAWGRLHGAGASPIRSTPISLVPREQLFDWLDLFPLEGEGGEAPAPNCSGDAAAVILDALRARGAMFGQELLRQTGLLPVQVEEGLARLISSGMATCDSYSGLRQLLVPQGRRRFAVTAAGRWSRFRVTASCGGAVPGDGSEPSALEADQKLEALAQILLRRYGVVFRRVLLRERLPVKWRDLVRVYRILELRGDVRGGRFVSAHAGEQYALPEAVTLLRKLKRRKEWPDLHVSAADPLNLSGILTPDEKVPSNQRRLVRISEGSSRSVS